jgi:hypothetical protein
VGSRLQCTVKQFKKDSTKKSRPGGDVAHSLSAGYPLARRHPTMRAHLASILRSEGVMAGLWIPGVGCNAVGAALCRGIGLGCYPSVRDWIVGPGGEKGGGAMFLAGLISGGIGYGLSTPLWQCKTVLQAGVETRRPLYKNGLDGLVQIAKAGGVRGLYRGASALIVRGALMNAGNTLGYGESKSVPMLTPLGF